MILKIKSLIQYLILIIAIIVIYSLLKSISRLTGATQKITDEQNYVFLLKKENQDLNQKLLTAQSPQFVEQEARNKLGLAKKGEIVVVLPDINTLKNLAPKLPVEKATLPDPTWLLWLKLFL